MNGLNWSEILVKASESLKKEGRHNQSSILKDAAEVFTEKDAEIARLQKIEQAAKCLKKSYSPDDGVWTDDFPFALHKLISLLDGDK